RGRAGGRGRGRAGARGWGPQGPRSRRTARPRVRAPRRGRRGREGFGSRAPAVDGPRPLLGEERLDAVRAHGLAARTVLDGPPRPRARPRGHGVRVATAPAGSHGCPPRSARAISKRNRPAAPAGKRKSGASCRITHSVTTRSASLPPYGTRRTAPVASTSSSSRTRV